MKLPDRTSTLQGKRVGVAGAGLAGLTAAWALERRGAEVFVFDARQRSGGLWRSPRACVRYARGAPCADTAVRWPPSSRRAGARSSFACDAMVVAWLSTPAGRVAVAGEHTSGESQGYMEGAVMSGLRAADDVKEILSSSVLSL